MAAVKLRTLPSGHLALLRAALDEAIWLLPEIERIPAIKACLADKILALAASGETEALKLSEVALLRVRESCANCNGCEGVSPAAQRPSSSFQRHLSSHPLQKVRPWN